MKLDAPFIQLPLRFDAGRLAQEIDALGDGVWRDHPQKFPGNSMLPLVAVNGDPGNEAFAGQMRPTAELEQCPYFQQVLASFGATVGRTRLMRLSGGAEVKRHADQGYYWAERVRIHVPVVTQPAVRFECDASAINMAAGECWIFDTWRQHRVLNQHETQRIHLVCDTVGGHGFWGHVRGGRQVGNEGVDAPAGWATTFVPYAPGATASVTYERRNVPVVMSPWELRQHLDFLLDESEPFPNLPLVRRMVDDLFHDWRGLWAAYGEDERGFSEYRRRIQEFVADAQKAIGRVSLRNQLPLLPAIIVMTARTAVAGNESMSMPAGGAMA